MVSTNVVNTKLVFISLQKFSKKQFLKHLYVEMKNGETQNVAFTTFPCLLFIPLLFFFFFFTSAFILKMKNQQAWFLLSTDYLQPNLWCLWRMTTWRSHLVFTLLRSCSSSWTSGNSGVTFASHSVQGERKSQQPCTWEGSPPVPHLLWEWSWGAAAVFSHLCGS